jgi:sulfur transfer complex TusBCD TusB component (DsrH family)
LKQAYALYKEFCSDTGIDRVLPQYKVREELRNYFDEFHERLFQDGVTTRSVYSGFNANKFKTQSKKDTTFSLVLEETESLLDELFANQPAQGATKNETPRKKWDDVTTVLADLDTSTLHFVRVPKQHVVIDFDLKDLNGHKSLERNLEAASVWPATYAELSKGGNGVHLHYDYEGDVSELSSTYSDGIEVKTLLGDSSLRRRLTKCNNIPVATISSGLPVKEKKVLASNTIKSEKGLRDLIARNLKKEIHPGTKPSIDFIKHILDEAYESGMSYDVSDLSPKIMAFANNSSNQAMQCLKIYQQMKFKSEDVGEPAEGHISSGVCGCDVCKGNTDSALVIYDVEVYPNLFVVCWKYRGDPNVVRMINPSAAEVEKLFSLKLVGFNNRRYDNHILYGRFMGYNNEQLYQLSQKIIDNDRSACFGEAYNLSYADIYDFSSKKQGLKKFMIELGLHHLEMDIPWDQPVPDDMVDKVVEYCVNDVIGTEAVLEARKQDLVARQILAELSGLTVNDTTQKHTARIIFGNDRNPQQEFVYTDLSKEFPGYTFDPMKKTNKSEYRGEDPSEGGYVYAEPGIYENVAVLDVASMHPTSIIELNLFGDYTPKFKALLDARIAIKHKDYKAARKMLNGKLEPFLEDENDAEALSYALKIVINIVYGLTSAKFDNAFRDIRNKDNIVAKRGALFMIDLKQACQEKGLTVAHIKTDSIKIPNATPEDIDEIMEFGAKYGYTFEHEATYEKFCLVNDAVYIARKGNDKWEAVGAQFQHPYVFKKLFSHEEVTFDDLCETKQVTQGAMYLDFEHDRPMALVEGMRFVGRVGRFVPVTQKSGGAMLYRVKDDKTYAVTGTKGYLWLEAEAAKDLGDKLEIDMTYFDNLIHTAYKTIEKFGDFDAFVS